MPFTNCISKINNTQVDDAHVIDVVVPANVQTEYCGNYSKTSGILWQYSRNVPTGCRLVSHIIVPGWEMATAFVFVFLIKPLKCCRLWASRPIFQN